MPIRAACLLTALLCGACVPFEITDVELPDSVTSDGQRASLSVSWEGEPVFPVEVIYQPRPDGCPAGVTCSDPSMTFEQEANPLVFPEAVWCTGIDAQVFFDYEVVIADAEGRQSAPFEAGFSCVP